MTASPIAAKFSGRLVTRSYRTYVNGAIKDDLISWNSYPESESLTDANVDFPIGYFVAGKHV